MIPPHLSKGDTIGIIAPSHRVIEGRAELIENFRKRIEELGFKIKYSDNLFGTDRYGVSCAGPKERAGDYHQMLIDPEVKAVWCYQGGDTANEVLPHIDFSLVKKYPKILIGKSDIDVLLMAVNRETGLITFHGPDTKKGNGREFDFEYTEKWLNKRIVEHSKVIEPMKYQVLREGKCEGKLVGCNLTSTLKLAGTRYFPDFNGAILLIESYVPETRKVLCKLEQLRQIGVFEQVAGIVVGNIHKDENEMPYEDIVLDFVEGYSFPVIKIDVFGHYQPHAFIPIGARARIDEKLEIIEDFLS